MAKNPRKQRTAPSAEGYIADPIQREAFLSMMLDLRSWEDVGFGDVVAVGAEGVKVYRDPIDIITNSYGIIPKDLAAYWRREVEASLKRQGKEMITDFSNTKDGPVIDYLANMGEEESFQFMYKILMSSDGLGIARLPLAIQGQAVNFGIHRSAVPVSVLSDMLVEKGYLSPGQRSSRVTDAVAAAAEKFYRDVGVVGINNAYAEQREKWYIANDNGRFLNAFIRRARDSKITETPEQMQRRGFVVTTNASGQKIVLMPEVNLLGEEPIVQLSNGANANFGKWYWENLIVFSAKSERMKSIEYQPKFGNEVATPTVITISQRTAADKLKGLIAANVTDADVTVPMAVSTDTDLALLPSIVTFWNEIKDSAPISINTGKAYTLSKEKIWQACFDFDNDARVDLTEVAWFDLDGNGRVDRADLARMQEKLKAAGGYKVTNDPAETLQYYRHYLFERMKAGAGQDWQKFNLNKSGFIDKEDLDRMRGKLKEHNVALATQDEWNDPAAVIQAYAQSKASGRIK